MARGSPVDERECPLLRLGCYLVVLVIERFILFSIILDSN